MATSSDGNANSSATDEPSLRSTWSSFPVFNSDGTVVTPSTPSASASSSSAAVASTSTSETKETPPTTSISSPSSVPSSSSVTTPPVSSTAAPAKISPRLLTPRSSSSGPSSHRRHDSSPRRIIDAVTADATPTSVLARLVVAAATTPALTQPTTTTTATSGTTDGMDRKRRSSISDTPVTGARRMSITGNEPPVSARLSARGRMQAHQSAHHPASSSLNEVPERGPRPSMSASSPSLSRSRTTVSRTTTTANPSKSPTSTSLTRRTSALRGSPHASPRTPNSGRSTRTVGFGGTSSSTTAGASSSRASPRPSTLRSTSSSSLSHTMTSSPSVSRKPSLHHTSSASPSSGAPSTSSSLSTLAPTVPRLHIDPAVVLSSLTYPPPPSTMHSSAVGASHVTPTASASASAAPSVDITPRVSITDDNPEVAATLQRLPSLGSPIPSQSALSYLKQGDARDMTNPTARYKIKVVHSLIEQIHLILNVLHDGRPRVVFAESANYAGWEFTEHKHDRDNAAMISPLKSPRDTGPYERKLIIAEGLEQCMKLMDTLMRSLDSLILNVDAHGRESYDEWIAPEMDKLRERMNAVLAPIALPPPPPPPPPPPVLPTPPPEETEEFTDYLSYKLYKTRLRQERFDAAEAARKKRLPPGPLPGFHEPRIDALTDKNNKFHHVEGAEYCFHAGLHPGDPNKHKHEAKEADPLERNVMRDRSHRYPLTPYEMDAMKKKEFNRQKRAMQVMEANLRELAEEVKAKQSMEEAVQREVARRMAAEKKEYDVLSERIDKLMATQAYQHMSAAERDAAIERERERAHEVERARIRDLEERAKREAEERVRMAELAGKEKASLAGIITRTNA